LEIEDPIDGDEAAFRSCFQRISDALAVLAQRRTEIGAHD
jgi:hypothetical protein